MKYVNIQDNCYIVYGIGAGASGRPGGPVVGNRDLLRVLPAAPQPGRPLRALQEESGQALQPETYS